MFDFWAVDAAAVVVVVVVVVVDAVALGDVREREFKRRKFLQSYLH